jgi:hypothetical protein
MSNLHLQTQMDKYSQEAKDDRDPDIDELICANHSIGKRTFNVSLISMSESCAYWINEMTIYYCFNNSSDVLLIDK